MIQRFEILFVVSLVCALLLFSDASAQSTIGAKGAALGNATTALYEDSWGLFSNPSTISSNGLIVGFYGLQYYGFPEITDISSIISIPLLGGHSAIGFYRYGDDLYAETNINTGFKYEFQGIHAGASLQYRHVSFGGNYGSGGAINISLGLLAEINESLWFGAKIRNINRAQYSFEFNDEELPQDISIGLMYNLEQKATFVFDVIKDVRFPVAYRGGLEVEIIDNFIGRIGATYEPITYTFGFGYKMKGWQFNVAIQQHEILGISPGADIILDL